MSEHTKGRLSVEYQGSEYGYDLDTEDRATLAEGLSEANARRLAACWNAFTDPAHTTEMIEKLCEHRVLGKGGVSSLANKNISLEKELAAARALLQQQDALLGNKACATKECRELLAARALLREVLSDGYLSDTATHRIRSHLDACDTLEGAPNAG